MLPMENGYYWFREVGMDEHWCVVLVSGGFVMWFNGRREDVSFVRGKWIGPIGLPEEASRRCANDTAERAAEVPR